jgi:streptogramin lyase
MTTRALILLCVVAGVAHAAAPEGLVGRVTDEGGASVVGALVTARNLELARETTVYVDADGNWALPALPPGRYHLRVRRPGFRDRVDVVDVGGATRSDRTLVLERETDPRELAWQLPANRWLALAIARLPDDAAREEFLRQCTFCHQQGRWATRVQRDPEEWRKLFALMARMGGILSTRVRSALPEALNAAYDESSYVPALGARFTPPPPADAEAARAVITEWEVGGVGSMQHDLTVHPDGRVYSVDTTQDKVYRLDPRTGERRTFDIPRGDSPLGGVFTTQRPIPANADAHVAPHSLQVAPDGSIWITLCLGNKIARFDPKTERFEIFLQEDGLYPHTLRFDARGRAFYTLAVSNHIAMIDPKTGERRTWRLPARSWGESVAVRAVPWVLWLGRWVTFDPERAGDSPNVPVPYGIDVAPDGPARSRDGRHPARRYAVRRAAPATLRRRRQPLDPRLQLERARALRPALGGVPHLGPADRAARHRDALRAQRGPADEHGLDLRHDVGHADPLRAGARALHGVPAPDPRHVHARDRLRRGRRGVDVELEPARVADRGRGSEDHPARAARAPARGRPRQCVWTSGGGAGSGSGSGARFGSVIP